MAPFLFSPVLQSHSLQFLIWKKQTSYCTNQEEQKMNNKEVTVTTTVTVDTTDYLVQIEVPEELQLGR